jgi:hypothetical protein
MIKSKQFLTLLFFLVSFITFSNVIHSISDGDFNDDNIWSTLETPSKTDSVILHHDVFMSKNVSIKLLNITDSASLDLNSKSLSLTGDFTCNGNFTHNTGSVEFKLNGANLNLYSNDTISFYDLSVRCNIFNFNSTTIIDNELLVGDTYVNTNDNLILNSVSDNTARIGEVRNYINGKVRVKRYLPYNNVRLWSYLSSPVSTTVSDWQDEILITGNFENPSTGWTIHNNSSPSLYYYDESLNVGHKDLDWVSYPTNVNSVDAPLETGRGYSVYVRDNPDRPDVLDSYGEINQGNILLNLSYTKSIDSLDELGTPNDGWHLIGNPYPSQISWDLITEDRKINIDNSFYYVDNQSNNIFRYYSNGVGVPADTKGTIASSQAIWVRSNNVGASIEFTELDKTNLNDYTFYRMANSNDIIRVYLTDGDNNDEIAIRLNDESTMLYDNNFDIYTIHGGDLILSSLTSDNKRLTINNVPCNFDTINLDIKSVDTSLEISFSLPMMSEYYLYNKVTCESVLINSGYPYTIDATHDYYLVQRPSIILNDSDIDLGIDNTPYLKDGYVNWRYESEYALYDINGTLIDEGYSDKVRFNENKIHIIIVDGSKYKIVRY